MIGLYLHIPFCRRKCPYCDFYSVSDAADTFATYTEALCERIRHYAALYHTAADTLYCGGGTPSLLGAERLVRLVQTARESFRLSGAEITAEVNPEKQDIDFAALRKGGFNRISIGLQSAHDTELQALGRLHNTRQAADCIAQAKAAGFTNISLDLMLATPGQTKDSLLRSIEFCARQEVPHISAYLLKIEPDTPYARRKDKALLCDDDRQAELYLTAVEQLAVYGYQQYEISNFAQAGFEGRHNLKYWHDEEYLGLGPSAHSFINGKRFYYGRSFESFYRDIPTPDGIGGEPEEFILLGLRLREGITHARYRERFGTDIPPSVLHKSRQLLPTGYLTLTPDGIALTPQGFLVSNAVIAFLLS